MKYKKLIGNQILIVFGVHSVQAQVHTPTFGEAVFEKAISILGKSNRSGVQITPVQGQGKPCVLSFSAERFDHHGMVLGTYKLDFTNFDHRPSEETLEFRENTTFEKVDTSVRFKSSIDIPEDRGDGEQIGHDAFTIVTAMTIQIRNELITINISSGNENITCQFKTKPTTL